MKRLLLTATAIAAFTSAAAAADLPSRRAPPVYVPPPPPTFTWTGVYVGFNVGGTFNDYTNYRLFANDAASAALLAANARPAFLSTRESGFAGGGQIGYNFQLNDGLFGTFAGAIGNGISPIFGGSYGGVVAGIEADIDGTTARETNTFGAGGVAPTVFQSRVDFVGTVRGRLGYAFGNLLLFGTGGFAYANVNDKLFLGNGAGALPFAGGINKIQTGYAYGGGVEYAIPTSSFVNFFKASAVTVKAEFIHYDLGSYGTPVADPLTGGSYTARIRNLGNIARVGVNYKFGAPAAAPVVARY